MEILNNNDINEIARSCGFSKVINWSMEDLTDKIIGYLGDHLKLNIEVEFENKKTDLKLFIKCMPRFNKWKAEYLRELNFFKKEHVMLNELFKEFEEDLGHRKWRPTLFYIREDLFVFEDVTTQGYKMPSHLNSMTFDEVTATIKSLARFHAQSYIFEEKRSRELGRPYRIWEDYNSFLQEPIKAKDWRDAGMRGVIDFLKVFSKYNREPNFSNKLESVIPMLYGAAWKLMEPGLSCRNVVIHRDLWSNNIFLKKQESGVIQALIVDFQTVLYSSPMLDISSFMYLSTTRSFRDKYTKDIINIYYDTLREELDSAYINIDNVLDKEMLSNFYEDSRVFGITQAALIVPITAMTSEKREQYFSNPETAKKVNVDSRSKEFIEVAREDERYHNRVCELFDEIVERYIYPNVNGYVINSI